MINYFSRKDAIVLASYIKLLELSNKEREDISAEMDINDLAVFEVNTALRQYIEQEFNCYTNNYISNYLRESLNREFEIIGVEPQLHPCSCCGYKTIKPEKQYFVCPVCYWEDDGVREENTFSSAN